MKNKCLWCVFVELINFSKEAPCVKVLTWIFSDLLVENVGYLQAESIITQINLII